jgi:heat shock protein HslJ
VYNLDLKEDSTYTSEMLYLGENVKPYTEAGKYYYINEHVIALQKDTNLPSFIQVEEKRLRMLDGDTQIIQGDLADMYILKEGRAEVPKQESKPVPVLPTIIGNWTLMKLGDRDVSGDDFANKSPYIEFHNSDKRITGYDGCNRIGGDYTIEGNTLKFGGLFSTKMACVTRRGDEFAAFLNSGTFTYSITKGELTLTGANGKAVFVR